MNNAALYALSLLVLASNICAEVVVESFDSELTPAFSDNGEVAWLLRFPGADFSEPYADAILDSLWIEFDCEQPVSDSHIFLEPLLQDWESEYPSWEEVRIGETKHLADHGIVFEIDSTIQFVHVNVNRIYAAYFDEFFDLHGIVIRQSDSDSELELPEISNAVLHLAWSE